MPLTHQILAERYLLMSSAVERLSPLACKEKAAQRVGGPFPPAVAAGLLLKCTWHGDGVVSPVALRGARWRTGCCYCGLDRNGRVAREQATACYECCARRGLAQAKA